MRKLLTLTVLILGVYLGPGNIGTNSAQAHSLSKRQVSVLSHNMKVSQHTVKWYEGKGRWTLHKRFKTCNDVAKRYGSKRAAICYRARLLLKAHKARAAKLDRILHPKPVVVYTGHWAGWSCITNGAYLGAPHEGNGHNGSYSGRLGMTNPWMGYSPSTGDWVTASASEVYGIAERVSARYNWADGWMRGQWPNTYPPCAGFFR